MAEDKKTVVVYADWIELFDSLTDAEAGRLIKHFFQYVNDLNPEAQDRITELSFIPIKQQLKRDLIKWEEKIQGRSKAGKASAEARKNKATKPTNVANDEETATNPTDNVNDNVNVNVIDNNINVIVETHPLQLYIKNECHNISKLKKQLTNEEALKIEAKFTKPLILKTLSAMENKKDLVKKYVSVYLTLNNWCENDKDKTSQPSEHTSRIDRLKNL